MEEVDLEVILEMEDVEREAEAALVDGGIDLVEYWQRWGENIWGRKRTIVV